VEFPLGLVLSGGGSRGLAHVGLLRALHEEGIRPQCIAGTSAGALIGALHAAGYPPEAMLDFFTEVSPFRLKMFALRKPGFIDSAKIVAGMRRWFPDDDFAALGHRLFVTATDLDSGASEIFTSGPLILPLLASSSVPLVFTPTVIDGRRFVDGGIVNNFPVEPLLGLCDVLLGSWASPLSPVRPRGLASSFAVSQRALEIGMFHASRRKFHHVDWLLSPPELSRYTIFDTRRHGEIEEIGYQAARERMAGIRACLAAPRAG
jgi:NTE family protein